MTSSLSLEELDDLTMHALMACDTSSRLPAQSLIR